MWIGKYLITRDYNCDFSANQCWYVIDYYSSYLYDSDTLLGLLRVLITEWKHDKHLVG